MCLGDLFGRTVMTQTEKEVHGWIAGETKLYLHCFHYFQSIFMSKS